MYESDTAVDTFTFVACGNTVISGENTTIQPHEYGAWMKVDDAQHEHTCFNCGYVEQEDHTWDNGVVTTKPSYTAPGVRTYTCTGCDATKAETPPWFTFLL